MAGEILDNRGRGDAHWHWPTIHPEGRKFGLIAAAAALVTALLAWETVAWPLAFLSVGILAFFRDPERVVPQGENLIVSPADGLVSLIAQVEPPKEMMVDDGSGTRGLLAAGRTGTAGVLAAAGSGHRHRHPRHRGDRMSE